MVIYYVSYPWWVRWVKGLAEGLNRIVHKWGERYARYTPVNRGGTMKALIIALALGSTVVLAQQTTTQPPIALNPPPIAWLVIHPRDSTDQGFRQPPGKVVVGINTPGDLEICIERREVETVCVTIQDILDAASDD